VEAVQGGRQHRWGILAACTTGTRAGIKGRDVAQGPHYHARMLQRVMLIDDSDADLLYTRIVLERAGAAREVLAYESAREALALLTTPEGRGIDLILLDINMPGMNGFEFLAAYEQLRQELRTSAVVVMLTSSPDPADRERALSHASVKGYVIKPIDKDSALALTRMVQG
jgi:CheY-like chemotaxis protein